MCTKAQMWYRQQRVKYITFCVQLIVDTSTLALNLLSPSFSLLSVVPCTSLCVTLSVIPQWELTWGPGRVNKQSASPSRRDGEETRWRGGGGDECYGSISLVDLMRQRGRKTGGGMLFLSPHSAHRTPHALCSSQSWRQQAVRRRCSLCQNSLHYTDVWEQEGTPQKASLQPFKGPVIWFRKQGEPIHPLSGQCEQVGLILWCRCSPDMLTWKGEDTYGGFLTRVGLRQVGIHAV